MEALHIMTGAAWSYSTLHYILLHGAVHPFVLDFNLCNGQSVWYCNMVAASLTCDVTFCLCQLMHHRAGNRNLDSHACLTDSVK